jgi:hypothetical protein
VAIWLSDAVRRVAVRSAASSSAIIIIIIIIINNNNKYTYFEHYLPNHFRVWYRIAVSWMPLVSWMSLEHIWSAMDSGTHIWPIYRRLAGCWPLCTIYCRGTFFFQLCCYRKLSVKANALATEQLSQQSSPFQVKTCSLILTRRSCWVFCTVICEVSMHMRNTLIWSKCHFNLFRKCANH